MQTIELEHRPEWYYEYELVGVLVHSGGAQGGHYYSFIRERENAAGVEPRWFEFNDQVMCCGLKLL